MPKGAPGVPAFTKNDIVMPPAVKGFAKKVYVLGVGLHPWLLKHKRTRFSAQ